MCWRRDFAKAVKKKRKYLYQSSGAVLVVPALAAASCSFLPGDVVSERGVSLFISQDVPLRLLTGDKYDVTSLEIIIYIIDQNKRRGDSRRPMDPAMKQCYKIRSTVERANAHLKDWL